MDPIIRFENVWFRYAGSERPALKGINLTVQRGEFLLVTGPSGCGKSTLLRCMNGLIPHFHEGEFSGRVTVKGMDTRTKNVYELAQVVGLVFPEPDSQLVALEVQDDVAFGPGNLGLPKEEVSRRVDWALEKTGISGLRNAQVYRLSGGEQQKVAVASILALKPEVLALDEPTANLDPYSAKSLISLLGELNAQGVTIVLTEHRLSMASRYCTRVVLMGEGGIVLDADPEKAFTSREIEELGVEKPQFHALKENLRRRGLRVDGISGVDELLLKVEAGEIECDKV